MKVRQDAWTEENDLLLAETVLRHVREGSTQLNAFEEVGDRLNRTSAACGFRWNAVVRHQYEKALELAKKQRKQRQRLLGKDQGGKKKLLYQPPTVTLEDLGMEPTDITPNRTALQQNEAITSNQQLTLDTVITFLQNLNSSNMKVDIYQTENERLKREIADLEKTNRQLEAKVADLEKNSVTIQEDYETLMKIMNRARKLVLFDDEEQPQTKFKMDQNGNLEKLAE